MLARFTAVHHPWACLLFLAPLLAVYEYGVLRLGGPQSDAMRNGADAWIRGGLEFFGAREFLAAPVLILALFGGWTIWRWHDRPEDTLGVLFGMILESLAYGLGLWLLSQAFLPTLKSMGITLGVQIQLTDEAIARLITFIGAGIYEEFVFRLLLFNALIFALRFVLIPRVIAIAIGAVVSSVLFAAAHHIGPYGEMQINMPNFLFRVTAGLYFALVYWLRGFGVAVGAHAMYDVLVGIPWRTD